MNRDIGIPWYSHGLDSWWLVGRYHFCGKKGIPNWRVGSPEYKPSTLNLHYLLRYSPRHPSSILWIFMCGVFDGFITFYPYLSLSSNPFFVYIYMVCSILFSGIPFNLWLVFQGNSTKNWSVLLRQSFQGNFLKNLPENSHCFLAEDESFPSFVASQNPVFYRFPIHQSSNSTECSSFFLGNLSNPTNIEPENNSQSLEDNG